MAQINNSLVSIGIPVYNRPNRLVRAVESLQKQNYKNLEIIISDDCSPNPKLVTVIEKLASKDKSIRYFVQKENLGQVLNHVFVFNKAKGKYFKWMADDHIINDINFIKIVLDSTIYFYTLQTLQNILK